jgi:hypothetical protein
MEKFGLNLSQFVFEYWLAFHFLEFGVGSCLFLKLRIELFSESRGFLIVLFRELESGIAVFTPHFDVMFDLMIDYLFCFIIFIAVPIMISLHIHFKGLLQLIAKSIRSFAIIPILFRHIKIETLFSILREFFGRVRKMMCPIIIFIEGNAFFLVSCGQTRLDFDLEMLPLRY